jgi:hypothetical protein
MQNPKRCILTHETQPMKYVLNQDAADLVDGLAEVNTLSKRLLT